MKKLESLEKIVNDHVAALVATIGLNNTPSVRTMNFAPNMNSDKPGLFLFTRVGTDKVNEIKSNPNVEIIIGEDFNTLEGFLDNSNARLKGKMTLSLDYDDTEGPIRRKLAVDKVSARLPFLEKDVIKGQYENFIGIYFEIEKAYIYDTKVFGAGVTETATKEEILEYFKK